MSEEFAFVGGIYTTGLSAATIERSVERFYDAGFEPTAADEELVEYSIESGYDRERESAPLSRAIRTLVDDGDGVLYLELEGFELKLHCVPDSTDRTKTSMTLHGLDGALLGDDVTEAAAERRSDRVVEAIAGVTLETDPWGVIGTFMEEGILVGFPSEPPSEATLSRLAWLTAFGPEWCDELGGRDRLLETPVWNARELDNGAVLMRRRETPDPSWSATHPLSKRTAIEPADYVFEGWPTTDPDELRERELRRSPREHLDPFRSFDDGEYGTDILMCKSHAPLSLEETAYADRLENDLAITDRCQVIRVQRRGDKLWVAESGEFVRRLVDDEGHPIGSRPDDVPPEHELLSLTILLEDQRENPPSWYRIDDADDESISVRVNSFIVSSYSDSSMWQEE